MESSTMQAPHGFGQSPFFYYNPHPKPEHRQHGHFSPHPRGTTSNMVQDQRSQQRNLYSPTVGHARPMSCDPQSRLRSQSPYAGTLPSSLTLASPRPLCQKPTILVNDDVTGPMTLQTARSNPEAYIFPATPPLSVSASAIGSPLSSCGMVSTPGDAATLFFGHDQYEDMKVKCDPELQRPMTLAGGDWSWARSPPLTPVHFIQPSCSATVNQTSDLLSVRTNNCPSLSPSPSPLPSSSSSSPASDNFNNRHQSSVDFNFCDPRNLTVNSTPNDLTTQGLSVHYPLLPTLCAGDDEEHKLILGEGPILSKAAPLVNDLACFGASTVHGLLPPFDELSEFDSEEDLVGNLARFTPADSIHFIGAKRQRTEIIPFDTESFTSETDSDAFDGGNGSTFSLPSPSGSESSRRGSDDSSFALSADGNVHSTIDSRQVIYDTDHSEADSFIMAPYPTRSATAYQAANGAGAGQQQQQSSSSGRQQPSSGGQSNSGSSAGTSTTQAPAPVSRRGRKQSLTEDPSKTFVCDLCSRRFRRQEHLKRHYRSLHTQEKPFECNECGKKFSRSDNLAQHARTHGSGAIVMGVLEGGQMLGNDRSDSYDEDEIRELGVALFEAAHAVAGASINSSDEASSVRDSISPSPSEDESSPRKKRKRAH